MSRSFETFDFPEGKNLGTRYTIAEKMGAGWEGEVYRIVERGTGISRVAKFYYPDRNPKGITARRYALKLHRLRDCPVVVQYLYHDRIRFQGYGIEYVVSDLAQGEVLSRFQLQQPGRRFLPFEALHLLHALAAGVEPIHLKGQYHGDIHTDNILVERAGLTYRLKLLDFFDLGRTNRSKIARDVVDMVTVFHEILGGVLRYRSQPPIVKEICKGLRPSLITARFKKAGDLRGFLENYTWE